MLIAKPFGGYINILEVDDLYFEDSMMPNAAKELLKVNEWEERMNQRFNMMGGSVVGMKDTRWGRAAIFMFGFWALSTTYVMFERPDCINVSYHDICFINLANANTMFL